MPVDCDIEEFEDGSVTVWVSETERMFHQKGMAGFTLRPGKAFLEIKGVLYNRTETPQTFLWWANPAVAVNDHYQSVFPPDVNAVFDHGKRDVSTFPIATELIIRLIIRRELIFPITGIFPYRHLIWLLILVSTLWVVMKTIHMPVYCMWQTIMCHPERNNGPGEMVISDAHGTVILPMRMDRISN